MRPEGLRILTVVYGDEYKRIAEITIPLAEKILGQSIEVVSGDDWAQVKLCDIGERIDGPTLCIDADMIFRSWDWGPWDSSKFNAVLDLPYMGWGGVMCRMKRFLDTTKLINGGLWMATPEHRPVFARAHELMLNRPKHLPFDPLGDQYFLNRALQDLNPPINYIPDSMNFQSKAEKDWDKKSIPEDVRVIHVVCAEQKLHRIQTIVGRYGLT